jgi:Kdo2-lipid IVA lauroyltransferase/acyltransferase
MRPRARRPPANGAADAAPLRWRAADAAEYAALRMALGVFRALPLDAASWLMGALWRRVGPWTHRHARVMRNLALAFPDAGPAERRAIAALQWENLGRTFAEGFQVDRILRDPSRIRMNDPAGLRERLARSGKGLMVVSLHTANWEVAAAALHGVFRVVGLYRRLRNPLSDRYVRALREHVFDGGLLSRAPDTPGRIMRWVRDGNAAAMLADQREEAGIRVAFFGRETTASPFPAMVARRLGVPLLAGRAIRVRGARFVLEGVEILVPRTDDPQADVAALTQAIQTQFERWIRERPEEWMWVHDRWRAPAREVPQGRPELEKPPDAGRARPGRES